MSGNMKLKMLFDLEAGKLKNTRLILNLDMVNQFDLLVFDRIAQFYDTLNLEQEDVSSILSIFK